MKEEAKKIVQHAVFLTLATIDEDGAPRSTIVVGRVEDDDIVWRSDPEAIHSQNILRDGRISISAFSKEGDTPVQGLYIAGVAYDAGHEGYDETYKNTTHEYHCPIGIRDTHQSKPNRLYFKQDTRK